MTHVYDWYEGHDERVDLNDPVTYTGSETQFSWFPKHYLAWDADDLRREVHQQIAFSLYYMTILNPGFGKECGQYERVVGFARAYAREVREPDRWGNKKWLLKQLYMILDETENQC